MWKPPKISWKEESKLLNGIDNHIRETWPHLEMYFTMNGWIRKLRYK